MTQRTDHPGEFPMTAAMLRGCSVEQLMEINEVLQNEIARRTEGTMQPAPEDTDSDD
jgi:hypothetical protein